MDGKLQTEIPRFLVAGSSAVLVDTVVYFALVSTVTFNFNVAKAISFISGAIVAFFLNKFWTFKQKRRSWTEVFRFALLYLATLVVNVLVNALVLKVAPTGITLAFLAATGTSTILNFCGQKWQVFR
jgi:putative flippase GtrA